VTDPYSRPSDPAKRRSAALTDGVSRAPARAMLKGTGFTDDDLARPLIGVATSWIETMPCNLNQLDLAEQVKAAIRDGKLVPGDTLPLPGHVTLYSFVVADVNGDGKPKVVSLQSRSGLKVYDEQGRVLAYGAKYGQSAVYLEGTRANNDAQPDETQLPGRLRAVTLPGNGLGVLAAQNEESIGVFYRARNFTGGNVVALRLQDDGLSEVWRTERLAYIADFSELQQGGEPMLVIATVSDFEGLTAKPRSFVVVTPLGK
jgi:hypothetical protein